MQDKLLRHELGHLVGQEEKVDEAKGEFCDMVHRIMKEHGSDGSVHDRLMVGVAGAIEEQPKKGKPAPSWYVAASEKLAPLIQHRNAGSLRLPLYVYKNSAHTVLCTLSGLSQPAVPSWPLLSHLTYQGLRG